MSQSITDTEREAIKNWYTQLLHTLTNEMIRIEAVAGPAVEAKPVWISPYKILIARVWEASQKSQFIWAISGENAVTDHIAGNMAATPREAARHFALKWQMDADRLLAIANDKARVDGAQENMAAYTEQMIQHAESLYDMASRDDVWQIGPGK